MPRRRRKFDIFSMSFLDTICCAFGAIVLLYMILNAAGSRAFQKDTSTLRAEVDKLEEEVLQGYADLVVLRNSVRRTDTDAERTEGLSERVLEETARLREQLAEADKTAVSRREAIERLKADLKQTEESTKRLQAGTPAPGKPGNRVKGFVGTGDRQYLTGLKLGGERIAILVDVSASMLDETVVNVLRLRNMPEVMELLQTLRADSFGNLLKCVFIAAGVTAMIHALPLGPGRSRSWRGSPARSCCWGLPRSWRSSPSCACSNPVPSITSRPLRSRWSAWR